MNITLRKFSAEDVPLKVRWINDPRNNRYLHYTLPLEEDATTAWYLRIKDLPNRLDMTIESDSLPVGIAGLLQIDQTRKSAELYITVGEDCCKGKGVAGAAMKQLLQIAFHQMGLHRVYLYTETENTAAVRAYEKFGFIREGCLRDELVDRDGNYASRYIYSILEEEFEDRYGTSTRGEHPVSGAQQ